MQAYDHIIGAEKLIARFGRWPSFHDAEIVRLTLNRHNQIEPDAHLFIHLCETLAELDERGYYRRNKHTLMELIIRRFTVCELNGFNNQNVLFDLHEGTETVDGQAMIRVVLDSSYGLSGKFLCDEIEIGPITPSDVHGHPEAEG